MRPPRVWLVIAALIAVIVAAWWWLRPITVPVTVYFLRTEQNRTTLAPVARTVWARGASGVLAAALQQLLEGPNDAERSSGITSAIPAGTRLQGAQIRDGVVWADFGRTLESGGGSSSMLGRFWQIVYTATQVSQAPRVRILIDGQLRAAMGGEGVIIDHPIGRPPAVPTF